jgi:hypothetical protein
MSVFTTFLFNGKQEPIGERIINLLLERVNNGITDAKHEIIQMGFSTLSIDKATRQVRLDAAQTLQDRLNDSNPNRKAELAIEYQRLWGTPKSLTL